MKTIIAILMIAGTSAFCCGPYTVNETVKEHLAAIENGDQEKLRAVWAKEGAQIVEVKQGKAKVKDLEKTFKLWTLAKNPKLDGKILAVNKITKELAVAQISLKWQGELYNEVLTLAKRGGNWKIINKTYEVPKSSIGSYSF